jgi:putative ABC transport system permease protein
MIGMILVLISWLVFILSGLGNGLSTLAAASFKNMDANYVAYEEGSRASMSRSTLSEDLVKELESQSNVESAAPMGTSSGTILKDGKSDDKQKIDITILGINPKTFLEPKVLEGKGLSENNPEGVIVNQTLKDKGLKMGDTLELEGSTEKLKIIGFVENESYNHLPVVFSTMEKWRAIQFAASGSDKGVQLPVNAIMLQGTDIDPAAINKNFDGIETVTKKEAIQGLPGYKEENGTIMMMLAFLLAISAFVIAVFFYVLTLQKSNQFGIMKAIGASNGFLGKVIVSQVSILSLISILIGILLTVGTAAALPKEMPFALDPMLVIVYALILFAISVISSFLSVRKITKIDPLQAIGRVE